MAKAVGQFTISEMQDNTDIQFGGRNFILYSDTFTDPGTAATTGADANTIHPSIENGLWKIVVDSTTNSNWLNFVHDNIIEANFATGDLYTFSFEIKSADAVNTTPPRIYFKDGLGYYQMRGDVSADWSKIYYTGEWDDTNTIDFNLGWSGLEGTYYIRRLKFESGNIASDWTPAIEDITGSEILVSPTEPVNPGEGTLWYNTTNNTLYLYSGGQWQSQDLSMYATDSDLDIVSNNRSKVWIEQPIPPYNAGDLWIVQSGADAGKIKTCVQSRATGSFNSGDWINPLDAYTTNTELTNVIGTDPREWSSTSKSLVTLINDNTKEIEGQRGQISSLAVRASGIEMSFSRTGTMNFLGNSSGQNGVKGWTIGNSLVEAVSASAAADVRQSLVSLSAFKLTFTSSKREVTMTSDPFIPPTSDTFTVSTKVKVPGKYTYIQITIEMYSSTNGSGTIVGQKIMNIPYAVNAEDSFLLYHTLIDKNADCSAPPQSAKMIIYAYQDTSDDVCETTDPEDDKGKISCAGKLYKYNSTYTYLKPVYKKINIVEFDNYLEAENLHGDVAYKCIKDMTADSLSDNNYVAGVYYTIAENAAAVSPKLKPITDSYVIMMLDADSYYTITMNGTSENIETDSTNFPIPQYSTVYIGDIMVNGGNNVQTWTPRQDENLWGENIKFDYSGITIENIPSGYKRIIDSSSDIAYQIDSSGSIIKCIWKLTQDGFITNDIKCIGTFSMGYVNNEASPDLENTFTPVMEMVKNQDRTGIDEFIYESS